MLKVRIIGPISLLLLSLGLAAAGMLVPAPEEFGSPTQKMYVATLVSLLLLFVAIGWLLQGTWHGIFVNRRNRWSLGQTQTLLWSVLVLGAFVALWTLRAQSPVANPMEIGVDQGLLYVMGLATVAYGTGAYIHHRKGRQPQPSDDERAAHDISELRWNLGAYARQYARERGDGMREKRAIRKEVRDLREPLESLWFEGDDGRRAVDLPALRETATGRREEFLRWVEARQRLATPMGRLVRNLEPRQARFSDMLRSEEVGNAHRSDLSKAQLLVVSFLAMVMFAVATWQMLGAPCTADACAATLPVLGGGIANILFLAGHTGYLGTKAVGHTVERWPARVPGREQADGSPDAVRAPVEGNGKAVVTASS